MATTRLIPIRVNKGKSIASTLKVRVNYLLDSEKTTNKKVITDNPIDKIIFDSTTYATDSNKTSAGELVKSYKCDKRTVDMEFLLAKKEYEYITGRNQGERNVLAYHIRQSFAPGEIEPEKALEIGYELAMRFTKGEHAFIVATHTNSTCVHGCVK